jgi:hypothetical protein
VHSTYFLSAHCGSQVAHGSSVGEAAGLLQWSVLTYTGYSNRKDERAKPRNRQIKQGCWRNGMVIG